MHSNWHSLSACFCLGFGQFIQRWFTTIYFTGWLCHKPGYVVLHHVTRVLIIIHNSCRCHGTEIATSPCTQWSFALLSELHQGKCSSAHYLKRKIHNQNVGWCSSITYRCNKQLSTSVCSSMKITLNWSHNFLAAFFIWLLLLLLIFIFLISMGYVCWYIGEGIIVIMQSTCW